MLVSTLAYLGLGRMSNVPSSVSSSSSLAFLLLVLLLMDAWTSAEPNSPATWCWLPRRFQHIYAPAKPRLQTASEASKTTPERLKSAPRPFNMASVTIFELEYILAPTSSFRKTGNMRAHMALASMWLAVLSTSAAAFHVRQRTNTSRMADQIADCKAKCMVDGYCCTRNSGCYRPSCVVGCETASTVSSSGECKTMCSGWDNWGRNCWAHPPGFGGAYLCDGGTCASRSGCTNI